MGFSLRNGEEARDDPPAVVYCVVPKALAAVEPRLREHFAADPDVQVVVDRRLAERRRAASGDPAPADGDDRRAIDGRRTAAPLDAQPRLPSQLRQLQPELEFRRVDDAGWRRRCEAAERQAGALAAALERAAGALRSRSGLSPRRFLDLVRAEHAIEHYYRWRRSRH